MRKALLFYLDEFLWSHFHCYPNTAECELYHYRFELPPSHVSCRKHDNNPYVCQPVFSPISLKSIGRHPKGIGQVIILFYLRIHFQVGRFGFDPFNKFFPQYFDGRIIRHDCLQPLSVAFSEDSTWEICQSGSSKIPKCVGAILFIPIPLSMANVPYHFSKIQFRRRHWHTQIRISRDPNSTYVSSKTNIFK